MSNNDRSQFVADSPGALFRTLQGRDRERIQMGGHNAARAQIKRVQLRERRIPEWFAWIRSYEGPASVSNSPRPLLAILENQADPAGVEPTIIRRRSPFARQVSPRA